MRLLQSNHNMFCDIQWRR